MLTISQLSHSDIEDRDELLVLKKEAEDFVLSLNYFTKIDEIWLDRGWGYMMAVFYFEGQLCDNKRDNIWVIVGDLPPAIISKDLALNGAQAIREYINMTMEWMDENYKPTVKRLLDIQVPYTEVYNVMLGTRIQLIKKEILSQYEDEL